MISQSLKQWLVDNESVPADASMVTLSKSAARAVIDGRLTNQEFSRLQGCEQKGNMNTENKNPTAQQVLGGAGSVNVKRPSERYSTKKYTGKHVKTGLAVRDEHGREVETTSQQEMAKAGALFKFLAKKGGVQVELSAHDLDLMNETINEDEWVGEVGGQHVKGIKGERVKTLLNDSASGGVNINPFFFDSSIIQFPLLYGELLPFVDLVDMPRGAEAKGATLANPTVQWGPSEGTSIPEFNTASLVGLLDSNVFPVTYATEIGRDLLADADVTDLGGRVLQTVGAAMMKEMDRVIAVGDGTTQPQGIVNASTPIILSSANGLSGPMTVGDYESLMFTVPKQYRDKSLRPAFIGTDRGYMQARGVPIGPSDARRVFGMDEGSYELLTWPFKIQQDIPDTTLIFGCLAKYRMYRRQGQEVRFTDQGLTLALKNTVALVVRGRWAGRMVDPSAFAIMTDAAMAL